MQSLARIDRPTPCASLGCSSSIRLIADPSSSTSSSSSSTTLLYVSLFSYPRLPYTFGTFTLIDTHLHLTPHPPISAVTSSTLLLNPLSLLSLPTTTGALALSIITTYRPCCSSLSPPSPSRSPAPLPPRAMTPSQPVATIAVPASALSARLRLRATRLLPSAHTREPVPTTMSVSAHVVSRHLRLPMGSYHHRQRTSRRETCMVGWRLEHTPPRHTKWPVPSLYTGNNHASCTDH